MSRLRALRHPVAVAVALTALAVAALAVSAWFLADTQSKQQRDLRDRYADRVVVASSLIDSLFRVAFQGQAQQAADRYSAPRIPQAQLDALVKQGRLAYTMIVDDKGRILGASSRAPRSVDPAILRAALRSGVGLSSARSGLVESAVAYPVGNRRRVQVNASPVR